MDIFSFIEDDELLETYNGIWIKLAIVLKKKLIVNPSQEKNSENQNKALR